jgi:hypothetical protein
MRSNSRFIGRCGRSVSDRVPVNGSQRVKGIAFSSSEDALPATEVTGVPVPVAASSAAVRCG